MNTAELKADIISQITIINDKVRLEELLQLLKFQNDNSIYITNYEERNAIAEARTEIADGRVHYNSDVQKEINKWLKK